MIKNILVGADPELFLQNEQELISAEGLIGGTKEKPLPIPEYPGYFLQEDNVMVEFNIPPAENAEDFIDSIETMREYIDMAALIHDATISPLASGDFNPRFLRTPQAITFGCEPDSSVYLERVNEAPPTEGTLRTCGGHIHVGYDNPSNGTSVRLIKAMDMTLGLNSLHLDKDDRRRTMYGNAGAFRFKKFGVEYRTLSNFWIFNRELIKWAYEGTMAAIELVNSGLLDELDSQYGIYAAQAINNNNKEQGINLLGEIMKKVKERQICVE